MFNSVFCAILFHDQINYNFWITEPHLSGLAYYCILRCTLENSIIVSYRLHLQRRDEILGRGEFFFASMGTVFEHGNGLKSRLVVADEDGASLT